LFGYLAGKLPGASKTKEEDKKLNDGKKDGEDDKKKGAEDNTAQIDILMADVKTLKTENDQLKATVAKMAEEKHLAKVAEVVDLRIRAGLASEQDRGKEVERLKVLSAEALDQMQADYARFVRQAEVFGGPKAKYTPEAANKRIEDIRESFLGHRKETKTEGGK